jgi:hypothetical protein
MNKPTYEELVAQVAALQSENAELTDLLLERSEELAESTAAVLAGVSQRKDLASQVDLPRFGIKWSLDRQQISTPMGDGYWTPYHLAMARISALAAHRAEEAKLYVEDKAASAAQVEVMKNIRNDWQGLAVNDAKTLIAFIRAVDATPAACLAQVKADAGRAGFVAGVKYTDRFVSESDRDAADRYAERIRQEVKP